MKQDDEIDLMSWITEKREEGYFPGFEDTSTAVIFYYDKDKNMIPVSTQKASLVLSPHRMSKEEYGYLISGFKEKTLFACYQGKVFKIWPMQDVPNPSDQIPFGASIHKK